MEISYETVSLETGLDKVKLLNIYFPAEATSQPGFLQSLRSASRKGFRRMKAAFAPSQLLDKYYCQSVLLLGCRIFEIIADEKAAEAAAVIREVSSWNRTASVIILNMHSSTDLGIIDSVMPDRVISTKASARDYAIRHQIWAE